MQDLESISKELSKKKIYQPSLIIDADDLDHNLALLDAHLQQGLDLRLVVKSLPCIGLLQYIRDRITVDRFMCFHAPFVTHIAGQFPSSDILLGKPLPSAAFDALCAWFAQHSDRDISKVQWLIDNSDRLISYEEIAKKHSLRIRVNLEIDIGLHRGGYVSDEDFLRTIHLINRSDSVIFSGLMGYEAHASKLPGILGGLSSNVRASKQRYAHFKALAESNIENIAAPLCYNTGGSTTFTEYKEGDVANELSLGSILLKPTDFDLSHLSTFKPASYIATPILKLIDQPSLPGPSLLSKGLRRAGILPELGGFIYGGNWLATPCFPLGMKLISAYGHSSNQELYGLPKASNVNEGDLALFRPTQSEAVLLQFGDLLLYREGVIEEYWPTLPQNFFVKSSKQPIN